MQWWSVDRGEKKRLEWHWHCVWRYTPLWYLSVNQSASVNGLITKLKSRYHCTFAFTIRRRHETCNKLHLLGTGDGCEPYSQWLTYVFMPFIPLVTSAGGNGFGHVCLSFCVCLSCSCSNFWKPRSWTVRSYIFRIYRSRSCIKVTWSRSRSQEHILHCFLDWHFPVWVYLKITTQGRRPLTCCNKRKINTEMQNKNTEYKHLGTVRQ